VALGIVFIRSLFDTTIKNSEEAEKRLGLTVLASIPQYDYEMKKKGKK
jgi:capsular polysaccharide biosynthesis protein